MTRLRLGISTCPNDTFAFHALLKREVKLDGIEFDVTFADVETLNRSLDDFDIAKASAHAALLASDRVRALPSGWALGYGVGPVVLAAGSRAVDGAHSVRKKPLVLCPGELTTATLLWRLFHSEDVRLEQRVFSEIMPALESGAADLGVCIHEGRFTYAERGLSLVEDLGATWERETNTALPLGGIVVRSDLDEELARRIAAGLRASIEWGHAHRDACLPTMREHAQETSDDVLWSHVALYVNEWTLDLGATGRAALEALSRLGRERGLLGPEAQLHII